MKKHAINEHGPYLVKYIMHKIDLKGGDNNKRHKCRSRASVTLTTITNFFGDVRPYKKSNTIQMGFIEDLVLIIDKG